MTQAEVRQLFVRNNPGVTAFIDNVITDVG